MYCNSEIINGEEWLICPLDSNHKTPARRFEAHVRKCSIMNKIEIVRCPFNAKHYLKKNSKHEHLEHCPDKHRVNQLIQLVSLPDDDRYVPVRNTSEKSLEFEEESWESELKIVRQSNNLLKTSYIPPAERKKMHQEYVEKVKKELNDKKEEEKEEIKKPIVQESVNELTQVKNVDKNNNIAMDPLMSSSVNYQIPKPENTTTEKQVPVFSYSNAVRKQIGRGAGRGIVINNNRP